MKTAITEAIKTTLVVSNKESIHIAVDKIMKIASSRSMESQWISVEERLPSEDEWMKINFGSLPESKLREAFECALEMRKHKNTKSPD